MENQFLAVEMELRKEKGILDEHDSLGSRDSRIVLP
jgi:hypothetical protein